jgi:hypothetical protein
VSIPDLRGTGWFLTDEQKVGLRKAIIEAANRGSDYVVSGAWARMLMDEIDERKAESERLYKFIERILPRENEMVAELRRRSRLG